MILEIQSLAASYGSHCVFRDIDFSLRRHELLAVLGPNGAGKTTLLRCINGILRPASGSVLVEGEDVIKLDAGAIARKIAYVAQKPEPARLTAFDSILLGRKPHMGWRIGDKDLALVDAMIRKLGLQQLALRYTDRISSGELQKVGIARALVQEPTVMLLDEPTSNLDLKNQIDIMKTIKDVIATHRVGAIMTMHDLNLAMRFADRFLLLKDGAIYAEGACEQIRAPMIKEAYGVDVKVMQCEGFPVIVPED